MTRVLSESCTFNAVKNYQSTLQREGLHGRWNAWPHGSLAQLGVGPPSRPLNNHKLNDDTALDAPAESATLYCFVLCYVFFNEFDCVRSEVVRCKLP